MLNENEIDYLEQQIPILAETATKQAFWQTLASGDSVIIAKDGELIEVFPDGTRKVIKNIEKPIKVTQRFFQVNK
ncbi:MAG: hypothetical protein MUF58_15575 [Arcicella sp.]|jgi:hypothetical protein|nr:hypothetical protein [Arcicella sp.]